VSTRSYAAHKEICRKRVEDHQRQSFGMLPIAARHPGKCGCARVFPAGSIIASRSGVAAMTATAVPCNFGHGDKIVKWRGSWWNVSCVERVQQEEFRATCRFVLEEKGRKAWYPKGWTNDEKQAQTWRELAAMIEDPELAERVIERPAVSQ
jgi:hypothetical protein